MDTQPVVRDDDPEITAISLVNAALKDLDQAAQSRVIDYITRKLNLKRQSSSIPSAADTGPVPPTHKESAVLEESTDRPEHVPDDDLDGISPVAKKWMRRNDLTSGQLSSIFSLGVDEIDLVAKTVPGKNKKDRMRSVFLLIGIAAYLSGGVARFTHERAKEAGLHYDAFDVTNFSRQIKDFATEVSGSKEAGYNLTARGLTSATELIKQMI